MIRQMREECPSVDLRAEHAKFVDHWKSQPGSRGCKADWTATWRNWIRRAGENVHARARPAESQPGPSRADQKVQGWLDLGKDRPDQQKELIS
ncbi:hypothetical protein FG87_21970 [Nocardia vulneris]|uniref:Uncharacterized protein n=1 Tax=Nocardia vulneris TaxID=1141657 RepID=A0ABR4ZCE5_9NOCA|nr:hypothetical protein FG87_21970 [Nocardia vulneris]